jgi:hypothetical protein
LRDQIVQQPWDIDERDPISMEERKVGGRTIMKCTVFVHPPL